MKRFVIITVLFLISGCVLVPFMPEEPAVLSASEQSIKDDLQRLPCLIGGLSRQGEKPLYTYGFTYNYDNTSYSWFRTTLSLLSIKWENLPHPYQRESLSSKDLHDIEAAHCFQYREIYKNKDFQLMGFENLDIDGVPVTHCRFSYNYNGEINISDVLHIIDKKGDFLSIRMSVPSSKASEISKLGKSFIEETLKHFKNLGRL